MKKFLNFYFIALSAILLFVASCEKEDPQEPVLPEPPTITLDREEYLVEAGKTITIQPVYTHTKDAEFEWSQKGGEVLCRDSVFHYSSEELGEKLFTIKVSNPGGEASKDFKITVTDKKIPTITLDNEDGIYSVKVGKSITIKPTYTNAENAKFAWAPIGGEVICSDPEFTYSSEEVGEYYFSLTVTNDSGEAYKEFKINVVPLKIPKISLNVPEGGYVIVKGTELELKPIVDMEEEVSYLWTVDGEKVAETKDFTFISETVGDFALQFTASSEDGSASVDAAVRVVNEEDIPFRWTFDQTEYNLSTGRQIRIKIWDIRNAVNPVYVWTVNGEERQRSAETQFIFSETEQGTYDVCVTMESDLIQISQDLIVNVCPPEGTYRRGGGQEDYEKVFEYMPAPGQFINDNVTLLNMDEAAAYADEQMKSDSYVSLGGFGGYLVVGFDHSIDNNGDYNIEIEGNSFDGSSEPGIVWVMQDENGDRLPNDTWYELKGSEFGKAGELRDYSVTYYKPTAPGMDVQWEDSEGRTGQIDYLQFHIQDYYYPLWAPETSYTLRGTCLPSKTVQDPETGYWTNGTFDWGYTDNFSAVDKIKNVNVFKISNAVTFDGKPANLKYVDFIKVQTGVNEKAGWTGELSTEVLGVRDYNMTRTDDSNPVDGNASTDNWNDGGIF